MSTDVLPPVARFETFQERLAAKLRADLADMIQAGELKAIIEQTVQDAFFKPRPNPRNAMLNQWQREPDLPPLAEDVLREQLSAMIKTALLEHIAANPEQFEKLVKQTLERGFLACAANAITELTSPMMYKLQQDIFAITTKLNKQ